ncbi:hypothetical protein L0Y46_03235, partial [bacterium]|nr:hypothetical protein [bacterium]
TAPPGPEVYEKVKMCYEKMMQGQTQQQYPSQYPKDPNQFPQYPSSESAPPPPEEPKPTSFLDRLVANALAPFRWLLGK